jgi:transcriptional regulator with XRE-family HTH domain
LRSIADRIRASRRKRKLTMDALGRRVGLSKSAIFKIEKNQNKNPLDPHFLIRIAEVLQDPLILVHYCNDCTIHRHLLLQHFPELKNSWDDPAAVLNHLRQEMIDAVQILDHLVGKHGVTRSELRQEGPFSFSDEFVRDMRKILGMRKAMEMLEFQWLIAHCIEQKSCAHLLSDEEHE